ncbi:MAG: hypothetical protein MZV63_35955 [Marinilabiliales bacterium]|nr:hypothetical protein [Marinilabiliales bacterium]
MAAIDRALAEINAAWQAASEDMYKQAQGDPGARRGPQSGPTGADAGGNAGGGKTGGDEQVTDVDFEEVK